MHRRALFALPIAAQAAISKLSGLRLSVRVEPLFPGLTLAQQLERVAAAGYAGYEFGDWRAVDPKQIVPLQRKLGLECVCLVGNKSVNPKGMGLCNPSERAGFLAEIKASAEAAQRFETQKMVVLSGFKVAGMTRDAQHASMVEGLKRAHDIVARYGVTMIVEVINTLAKIEPLNPKGNNHADYFLDRTPEAFAMVREVGSPYFQILYDLYHVQIMEGNLIETIRENIGHIGHIHIADVPGRHEPGTGEINFSNVFRTIHQSGYKGYVGMEYIPKQEVMQTLADVKRMAESAAR
ncbi:MAG TPA: TIM barrel protein [Bryobacteraceae bacterium]|nr:TIM barrel protein [Bryobacteraceae bacterium]